MFMTVDRVDEGMIPAFFFFWGGLLNLLKAKFSVDVAEETTYEEVKERRN
jgi:hypothetical protein